MQGGFFRVTTAGNLAKEKISSPTLTMEHPGYIYVFLYNRSNSANWVYFDDFKVTHQRSPIVAGADFYPFGLPMEGREITQEDYRWGYQGQYAEKDTVTGWNQFQLRMYDARFGRWLSVDPYRQYHSPYLAMGNMPNIYSDPNGGWSWVTAGIGFAVGAAAGYAIGGDWQSALIGGVAGGLVGGASFNQSRKFYDVGVRTQNSVLKISANGFGKGIGRVGKFIGNNPGIITGALRVAADNFEIGVDNPDISNSLAYNGKCCPGDPRSQILWNSTQIDEMYNETKDKIDKGIEDFKDWLKNRAVDGEEILEELLDEKLDEYMKKFKTPYLPPIFIDPRLRPKPKPNDFAFLRIHGIG